MLLYQHKNQAYYRGRELYGILLVLMDKRKGKNIYCVCILHIEITEQNLIRYLYIKSTYADL